MAALYKVLFICSHNSARSQMAEAFLNLYGRNDFLAESAGLEPTEVNPYVIEVMKEVGIDLTGKATRNAFQLYKEGRLYDYVITVCNEAEKKCPTFPGLARRLHWPFSDPAEFTGEPEEILVQTRRVRDQIQDKIKSFVNEFQQ